MMMIFLMPLSPTPPVSFMDANSQNNTSAPSKHRFSKPVATIEEAAIGLLKERSLFDKQYETSLLYPIKNRAPRSSRSPTL